MELYANADVFCLPTRGDCLPMVLSEAAAMALPVVATDVGAIREIVEPELNGLLVKVDDVDALAVALGRLARDGGLRRRMGIEGARLTERRFDARVNAVRLVDTILSIL
jgi:glycosyltransferase involved in cell wall biosynthesis